MDSTVHNHLYRRMFKNELMLTPQMPVHTIGSILTFLLCLLVISFSNSEKSDIYSLQYIYLFGQPEYTYVVSELLIHTLGRNNSPN